MAVAVRLPGPSREATVGLRRLTVGLHLHSFGLQSSHVRATHVSVAEEDDVARSEPCVVEQRLDVAEAWVAVEAEPRQAPEPAQRADVGDRVIEELEARQVRDPAQRANVADLVVVEEEVPQPNEPAQRANVADRVVVQVEVVVQARKILDPREALDPGRAGI